jgi:hypothetical protein
VSADYSPAISVSFVVQIDDERLNVTAKGGGGNVNWTVTRGYEGTTATNHDAQAFVVYHDWATSNHAVDVVNYWKYTYAWKSLTGQVSNRAPLETNPDLMSSATFPFFDKVPKMTVQGHADTTNIPTINIYRTQDGGGTFYFVGDMANAGAGDRTFEDKYLDTGASSSTNNDPIPDDLLDQGQIAPSLTSNTIPPPVAAPGIIGTTTPVVSTALASYSGRIWFGIDNFLYFSSLEETREGVPEECFPAGINGNFFKFQHKILNLEVGPSALFVFTTQHTYKISGSDLQTFNVKPLLHNIGGYGSTSIIAPSSTRMGEKVAFLTHDRRIGIIYPDDKFEVVSGPLGNSLNPSGSTNAEFHFVYWGEKDLDLLMIFYDNDDSTSKVFVYDLALSTLTKSNFWHSPWTIVNTCALASKASINGTRRVVFGTAAGIKYIDFESTFQDEGVGYDWVARGPLMSIATGNHVNALRAPSLTPITAAAMFERTRFAGDRAPEVTFAYDDFWTDECSAQSLHEPTVREQSKWYQTLIAESNRSATRIATGLAVYESATAIEVHSLTMTWNPDQGAKT